MYKLLYCYQNMELLNSLLFMPNEMSPYILLGFFIAGLMHTFVPQKHLPAIWQGQAGGL